MKIEFLGTGAADWSSDSWVGRTDYRRYSSALINGDLLIDPGPHVCDYMKKKNNPELFAGLKNILVTHSHQDHYCLDTIRTLCMQYNCAVWGYSTIHYRNQNAENFPEQLKQMRFTAIEPGRPVSIGNYQVTPLPSNHNSNNPLGEIPLNYLVEQNEKKLFYGLDSAWLTVSAWECLRKKSVDLYILDCTVGFHDDDWRIFSHSGVKMCSMIRESFLKNKDCKEGAKFVLSHFARTLLPEQEKLEKKLENTGLIAAYDGMILLV